MRVATIVGARPQFIKAAPLDRALKGAGMQNVLIHTGQHYDANMSGIFFTELGLSPPDHNLNIGSGPHGRQTGQMMEGIESVLLSARPDWVIVFGDTNSTLAGALAAVKLHIPVAHVEAGLRSFNRAMPEEINRVLCDHASTLNLAPTPRAVTNLRNEGIGADRIRLVGDVMLDAALYYGPRAGQSADVLARLGVDPGPYLLATVHRAENTESPDRMAAIFDALCAASASSSVVVPLHPRTRKVLKNMGIFDRIAQALHLVSPVGFLDMIALVRGAQCVVTDSGGLQKEACFHRTPCVTVRAETEWADLVALGWNRLAPPTDASSVAAAIQTALGCDVAGLVSPSYGQGDASEQICAALRDH